MGIDQNNQLKPAPPTIRRYSLLPLLETNLPQKEWMDFMENKGISNKLLKSDNDGIIITMIAFCFSIFLFVLLH